MRGGIRTGCLSIVRYTLPSRSVGARRSTARSWAAGGRKGDNRSGGPDIGGQCRVGQASLELLA